MGKKKEKYFSTKDKFDTDKILREIRKSQKKKRKKEERKKGKNYEEPAEPEKKQDLNDIESVYKNCYVKFERYSREDACYVSEIIYEYDVKGWISSIPVFISAQTGSGKNFFIKDVLIRLVNNIKKNSNKCKILLVSNRVALNRQAKLDLSRALVEITGDKNYYKLIENDTDQEIDQCWDFGIITICSYHQLYIKIANSEYSKELEDDYEDDYEYEPEYKYVICDECHFFTGDAVFNPCTDEILTAIIRNYRDSVRIYMSATLEDTFLPIIAKEYESTPALRQECKYYYFERNYDYVKKIYVYKELNQLVSKIKEGNSKWLIFVKSRDEGNYLKKVLEENGIKKVTFLTADSKETVTYRNLVKNEKFDEQVLISTAVLDNGINIKDKEVKNVVISTLDRTEFIQMLGRVRITGNQQINLYIKNYTIEEIEKILISDVDELIARLRTDFQTTDRNIFYNTYNHPIYKINELFYLLRLEKTNRYSSQYPEKNYEYFDYNPCAIYKLVERIGTFMEILRAERGEYFLPTESPEKKELYKRESIRAELYNLYRKARNEKNNILGEHIYHILETEGNYKHRVNGREDFSFRNDFLIRMLENLIDETENLRQKYIQKAEEYAEKYDENSYNMMRFIKDFYEENKAKALQEEKKLQILKQQKEIQEKWLNLSDSEVPILTEQAHWIEKNLNKKSDFEYLEEVKSETEFTEKEVEKFLKEYAIKYSECESYLKKLENRWSISEVGMLDSKDCLIGELKSESENPKIIAYKKIFKWFCNNYGIANPDELIKEFDDEPYQIGKSKYKLVKVRGTKTVDQKMRYIFLEFEVEN